MECPVCYETTKLRTLSCYHRVCCECITKMQENNLCSCPMCRRENVIESKSNNNALQEYLLNYLSENATFQLELDPFGVVYVPLSTFVNTVSYVDPSGAYIRIPFTASISMRRVENNMQIIPYSAPVIRSDVQNIASVSPTILSSPFFTTPTTKGIDEEISSMRALKRREKKERKKNYSHRGF